MKKTPDDFLFPRDSIARDIFRPGVVAVGAGRAIVMQLAHPAIAAGIAGHSSFRTDPIGRTIRTADAFRRFFFRTRAEAEAAAAKVRAIHDGVLGEGYSANDPDLLLWVHATTIDSLMRVYTALVQPLTLAERAAFYEESTSIAELLGCPRDHQPSDIEAFDSYIDATVCSLAASDTGRLLAHDFLYFPVRPWARPLTSLYRLSVLATVPPRLRQELHLQWLRRHQITSRQLARLQPLYAATVTRSHSRRRVHSTEGRCIDCGTWSTQRGPGGRCPFCARKRANAVARRTERIAMLMGLGGAGHTRVSGTP